MAKVNVKTKKPKTKAKVMKPATTGRPKIFTAGGALAQHINPKQELRRRLMTCMLWEKAFYEGGDSIAKHITELVPQVHPSDVLDMAVEAKVKMKLRHAPLFVIRELARYTAGALAKSKFQYKWNSENVGEYVEDGLANLVNRADELSEFLAMYWRDGKQPIAASVKRGLSKAFSKFDAYQLAKWNRDVDVKLRDVMFLTHPNPGQNADLFRKLAENTLESPDTWEIALSAGGDKKETFERLIRERKLGGMALLRNLRNMVDARVDVSLIRERLEQGVGIAMPFDFMTAAKYAPSLSGSIEKAMLKAVERMEKLPGRTLLVVDCSGSMGVTLSGKSEKTRMQAAGALAILARGVCEESVVYATAGDDMMRKHATKLVPDHLNGFALGSAIERGSYELKIGGGGIFLVQCLEHIQNEQSEAFDRVIVFTDEQDCDLKCNPALAPRLGKFNYVVNVANERNGISYKNTWHHIDGWSEHIFDYIRVFEEDAETA